MPRVDRGWTVIDVAEILDHIIRGEDEKIKALLEWAKRSEAIVITNPSPVTVVSNGRITRITLGIGSLVAQNPPFLRIRHYTINRPEWVDGCRMKRAESRISLDLIKCDECDRTREGGVISVIDYRDPVLAIINGMKGRFTLIHYNYDYTDTVIKAVINDKPAILNRDSKYIMLIEDNIIRKIIEYNASTIGLCE